MNRAPSNAGTRLQLFDYYAIEGLNSFSMTIFTLCLYFWTRYRFGFSDTENLLLASVYGLVYVPCAWYGGRLGDRLGYDRLIRTCIAILGALLLGALFIPWHGLPFVLLGLYTLFVAPVWPSIEAVVLHVRARQSLPQRVGLYNITWASATAIGFFTSGFLFEWRPDSILWVPALIHFVEWIWMGRRTPSHAGGSLAMEIAHRGDQIPPRIKQEFMFRGWLGNCMGNLMLGVLMALTPHIAERLQLRPAFTIWLVCSLLFARVLAFIFFWLWEGWHYRRGLSLAALWLAPVCFAAVFFVSNVHLILAALFLFGVAIGLSYFSSIYYSMAYGEHKGEFGGLHESVLGVGALLGPLLAAGAGYLTGSISIAIVMTFALVVLTNSGGLFWIHRATSKAIRTNLEG